MLKNIFIFIIFSYAVVVYAAGLLQNEDFSTQAELEGRGATKANLLNDTKIYVTADGLNKRLDEAITDGDIGGGGGGSAGINFVTDPSFEKDTLAPDVNPSALTSYTLYSTDDQLYSEFNLKYFRVPFTSLSSADLYIRDSFARSNLSGKQGLFSIWINADADNLKLCLRTDDATFANACETSLELSIVGDGTWRKYEIPFIFGTASVQYEIYNESFTGNANILVDNIYVGTLPDGYIETVGQAQFVGSLKYETTNCLWESANSGAYSDFAIDNDCVASKITGSVSAPSTKIPGIQINNARSDGYYKVLYTGTTYKTVQDGQCRFALSASSSQDTEQTISYLEGGTSRAAITTLHGNFRFNDTGNKTIRVLQGFYSGTGNCQINGNDAFDSKFTVHFFPDASSTVVTQNTELTAKTANEFSARISSGGGITSENYDWIDSCIANSTGDYTCTFKSNVFTVAPSVAIDILSGSGSCRQHRVSGVSTTDFRYQTFATNGTLADCQITAFASRQGADVNKSATIIGKFEQVEEVNKTLTASDVNEFSAVIKSDQTLVSSDYDWIDSCTDDGIVGNHKCTFKSGIFTVPPACVATAQADGFIATVTTSQSESNFFTVRTRRHDNVLQSIAFRIQCTKQEADVNKNLAGVIINASESAQEIADIVRTDIVSSDLCKVEAQSSSGTFELTNNTVKNIIYENELVDNCAAYNSSTGIFTATKAGYYLINGSITASLSLGDNENFVIRSLVNGSLSKNVVFEGEATTTKKHTMEFTDQVYLNVGQTLNIAGFQNSGSNVFLSSTASENRLSITELPDTASIIVNSDKAQEIADLVRTEIVSSDLVKVRARMNDVQSIATNTRVDVIYKNELEDNFSAYNNVTGIFTSPKETCYAVKAGLIFDTGFLNNKIIDIAICRGTTCVGASDEARVGDRKTTQTSNPQGSVTALNFCMAKDEQFIIGAFHNNGSSVNTLNTAHLFNELSITELPDTESIVKNLLAESSQTKCQTKLLSADVTSASDTDLASLNFTGLEVGKKYEYKANLRIASFTDNSDFTGYFKNGSTQLQSVIASVVPGYNIADKSYFSSLTFTATDTSFTFGDLAMGTGVTISSNSVHTNVTLCQLPDATIFTNEW